jgi:flagellar biosynthesis regulator FlaF
MTVKIVDRYDEIENQDLSSREVDEFTNQTIDMLKVADEAFKNILNNLYREKIVDMDVEMKVFQSMLEADGLNENELVLKNRAKERNE